MRTSLRRPAAVGVLVGLVLLGGWWKLLWSPQGAQLASAHTRTQTASANLVAVEQSIAHLKHLKKIAPQLAALEQKLSAAAPNTDLVDQFIITLNDLSQQAGVTLGAIGLSQPAASPGGIETLGVHVGVTGGYFSVQQFLDLLHATTRIVVVDTLSETPNKTAKAGSDVVSLTVGAHLLTGLVAPLPAVQKVLSSPTTTAAPSGIISGPVTKARNAVTNANANSAQVNTTANATGGP